MAFILVDSSKIRTILTFKILLNLIDSFEKSKVLEPIEETKLGQNNSTFHLQKFCFCYIEAHGVAV